MFEFLALILSFFYQVTKSYGFAIILLTVAVRLVLFPLTAKQMRSMQGMSRIQPDLKRLQAEHKDDRMKLQEEMTALYKREGINPVGGCLPLVLQIPVFIGLFNVIRGLSSSGRLSALQIDVAKPQYLSHSSDMYRSIVNGGGRLFSFGFDLGQSASGVSGGLGTRFPFVFLIVSYVVSAYVQQHLATRRNPAAAGQAAQVQQVMKIFPLFLGFFYYTMPAGLVLYFVASNLWTIGQQEVLARAIPTVAPSEAVVDAVAVEKSSESSEGLVARAVKTKARLQKELQNDVAVTPVAPASKAPVKAGKATTAPVTSAATPGTASKVAKPATPRPSRTASTPGPATPRPTKTTQTTQTTQTKTKTTSMPFKTGGNGRKNEGTKADAKRKAR